MSKKLFSKKELEKISNNRYVKNISKKGITYTDEFKRIFIKEYEKGILPRFIFKKYDFDIEVIGINRINSAGKRWRRSYRKNGLDGLKDTRKGNSGRPREKELSLGEKYERLKAKNTLLLAENELLKKLEMIER